MSSKLVSSIQYLMRVWELIFVVFRLPYLSISRSRTKWKSPLTTLWSFVRASIICTNSMKNSDSSSFGAYRLIMYIWCHLIQCPEQHIFLLYQRYMYSFVYILFKWITMPFDAPVSCEKYMSPFHSFFQRLLVCVVTCVVSCKMTILEFLFSNQCSTSLHFVLSARALNI